MNFERRYGDDAVDDDDDTVTDRINKGSNRPVTLYYMDPLEALQMHQEMKQMGSMGQSDIRITVTTLAKAIRQSSNKGSGLLTGSPVNPRTGKVPKDSGALRHKIVPSKRQLFYATRCLGRERVGLFGDTAQFDARIVATGALGMETIKRKREGPRNNRRTLTPLQEKYKHMEGHLGIPVFYTPELTKRLPAFKRIVSRTADESPIFFSYEDMMEAWSQLRRRNKTQKLPPRPETVEVYNLMDILSSMDRDEWRSRKPMNVMKPLDSIKNQFQPEKKSGLESLTFIPTKLALEYKEKIASEGNGKSRLRPMR